jgi:GNAT superfamily N-acetyltransferase
VLDSRFHAAAGPARPLAAPRIHLASPADVPFIVDAIVAESRNGHFACDCGRPEVLQGLWHQVRAIVSDGVTPLPGARDGAGGRAFVAQVGRANAGFAILVEAAPGSWAERIELFALSVHPDFRGAGIARHLVGSLVREARSANVDARVAFGSTPMIGLLKSCGFALGARSGQGTLTLEWRRDAVSR